MRYIPNPAHKLETTEAGPPRWQPSKEACPPMAPAERQDLLDRSVPADPAAPIGRRFAMRRGDQGLELYEAKLTRIASGVPEYHGHPTTRVPGKVLRVFRDHGELTEAEYRRLVRELG
jgi:hypothetical protein